MVNRILIIGGTGFIGHHLAKVCIKKKMKVTSISKTLPSKERHVKKVRYIKCLIEKKSEIKKKLNNKKFDFIVNLGGDVDHNDKKKTYSSHYIGCKNLADYFLKKKIKLFLQVGSSSEYGKIKSPQKESSITNPKKIYGKSKLKASSYLLNLYKKKKFPCTILRLYQVYGPGQDYNRFIPIVIRACKNDLEFPCSSAIQKRDFLYIDDLINCFFNFFKNSKNSEGRIFNIGLGKPIKLMNIIKKIKNTMNGGKPLFGKIKLRIDEPKIIYPDISLVKNLIKWKPETNFSKGLKKTLIHYSKINN